MERPRDGEPQPRTDVVASPALATGHLVVAIAFALLLAAAASGGPDYSRYEDWGLAGLSGSLWDARVYTISPLGVPLMMWSHGTGFVFAAADLATGTWLDFRGSAMLAGWIGALVLWAALLRVLWLLSRGDAVLTLLGAALFLTATHGGYFSHVHASESLALAGTGVLVWLAFEPRSAGRLAFFSAGLGLAFLIVIKPYWVLYGAGTIAVLVMRLRTPRYLEHAPPGLRARRGHAGTGEPLGRLALAAAPVVVAAAQTALTNRWMTGSWLTSSYQFGDAGFRSFDFADPELAAVLVHPWHGLLAYHPFYAIGALAVVLVVVGEAAGGAFRSRRGEAAVGAIGTAIGSGSATPAESAAPSRASRPGSHAMGDPIAAPSALEVRVFFALAGLAMLANLYIQAAWVVWWLGKGTFGMRGMAPAAAVVVPAFVAVAARLARRNPALLGAWAGLAAVCALWSTTLLAAGIEPQFHTYAQMFAGMRATLEALSLWRHGVPALLCLLALAALLHDVWRPARGVRRAIALASLALVALALVYLAGEGLWVVEERSPATLVAATVLVVLGIATVAAWRRLPAPPPPPPLALLAVAQAITLVVLSGLFFRLAARVEADIAAGRRPPHDYAYVNTFSTRDMRESCNEYRHLPAFRDKREAFKAFLIRHGVDPAGLQS